MKNIYKIINKEKKTNKIFELGRRFKCSKGVKKKDNKKQI